MKIKKDYYLILAIFPPNPQANQKDRNNDRLEKSRKKAESREPITICHENEEVHTSDSDTA
jgi:membrane carboxypeptidase/penicillin-binding protein PbpC